MSEYYTSCTTSAHWSNFLLRNRNGKQFCFCSYPRNSFPTEIMLPGTRGWLNSRLCMLVKTKRDKKNSKRLWRNSFDYQQLRHFVNAGAITNSQPRSQGSLLLVPRNCVVIKHFRLVVLHGHSLLCFPLCLYWFFSSWCICILSVRDGT